MRDFLGSPLAVFRGEYGDPETAPDFSTRFGSLSFSEREIANFYAQSQNHRVDRLIDPRVHTAFLAIKRPIIEQPDDAFIELAMVEAQLGRQQAERIAKKFAFWVMQTSPWTNGEIGAPSVEEFLEAEPDALAHLYMQAYPFFDNAEEVELMKAAGYDGAIYGGSGLGAFKAEFRVFDKASVWKIATHPAGDEFGHYGFS